MLAEIIGAVDRAVERSRLAPTEPIVAPGETSGDGSATTRAYKERKQHKTTYYSKGSNGSLGKTMVGRVAARS